MSLSQNGVLSYQNDTLSTSFILLDKNVDKTPPIPSGQGTICFYLIPCVYLLLSLSIHLTWLVT
jgi:hypothetical protein